MTTKPSADCDTDNELLATIFKVKLKRREITTRLDRYDLPDIDENFKIEV